MKYRRGAPSDDVAVRIGGFALGLGLALAAGKAIQVRRRAGPAVIQAKAAITIDRSIQDVYAFWHRIENFPWFMRDLESVQIVGPNRSRWRVSGPAGFDAEWEAQVVTDQQNHLISWRSAPGSQVENRGTVRFEQAPGGRGTEVHVEVSYTPPAGRVGHAAAWLSGTSPRQQMRDGLRRVKQLLELGDIPLSDGPGLSRPAQPAAEADELRALVGVES